MTEKEEEQSYWSARRQDLSGSGSNCVVLLQWPAVPSVPHSDCSLCASIFGPGSGFTARILAWRAECYGSPGKHKVAVTFFFFTKPACAHRKHKIVRCIVVIGTVHKHNMGIMPLSVCQVEAQCTTCNLGLCLSGVTQESDVWLSLGPIAPNQFQPTHFWSPPWLTNPLTWAGWLCQDLFVSNIS